MQILVTGDGSRAIGMMGCRPGHRHDGGFTLIEVMIVVVIMAVLAAFVVPSFVSLNQGSTEDEARRLVRALKLAADESALTGRMLRWSATEHEYYFEQKSEKGQWQPVTEAPYQRHVLADGVVMLPSKPSPEVADDHTLRARYPLGGNVMVEPVDLILSTTGSSPQQTVIRIEPTGLSLNIHRVQGEK